MWLCVLGSRADSFRFMAQPRRNHVRSGRAREREREKGGERESQRGREREHEGVGVEERFVGVTAP